MHLVSAWASENRFCIPDFLKSPNDSFCQQVQGFAGNRQRSNPLSGQNPPKCGQRPHLFGANDVGHVRDIKLFDGKELVALLIIRADIKLFPLIFAPCGCFYNHRQMTLRAYCFYGVEFR